MKNIDKIINDWYNDLSYGTIILPGGNQTADWKTVSRFERDKLKTLIKEKE